MEPIGFLLGVLTFGAAVTQKKPLRKAAVITTGMLLTTFDRLKTAVYEIKEEMEDIVAEAQYENMKKYSEAAEPEKSPDN